MKALLFFLKKIIKQIVFFGIFPFFCCVILFESSLTANVSSLKENSKIQKKKQEELTRIKNIFKYGTYQEQIVALKNFQKKKLDASSKITDAIDILIENPSLDFLVSTTLVETISVLKLKKYFHYFQKILDKDIKEVEEGELVDQSKEVNYFSLIEKSLMAMCNASNKNDASYFQIYFDDKEKNREDPLIIAASTLGLGITTQEGYTEKIKSLYTNTENRTVKQRCIESVKCYKDPKDIAFFKNIVEDESESNYQKWISIVALKEYAPHQNAFKALVSFSKSRDPNIASRAIYGLNAFDKKKVYPIFLEATKNNTALIRYYGVKALEVYNDKKTLELLEYKKIYDKEESIRNEAKRILEKKQTKTKEK